MVDTDCHVYIIAHARDGMLVGPVKVGIAKEPSYRVLDIQIGNPQPLQVAAWFPLPTRKIARKVEQAFHHVKADVRMKGEWFDLDVLTAILAMCTNIRACIAATADPELHEALLSKTRVAEQEVSVRRSLAARAH